VLGESEGESEGERELMEERECVCVSERDRDVVEMWVNESGRGVLATVQLL